MRNLNELNAIATLANYFKNCKAREEAKLDDNYEEAKINMKLMEEMLRTLEQMELMVNCEEDFMA